MNEDDTRLRFRVWVDGALIDEEWLDCAEPVANQKVDEIRDRHASIVTDADKAGQTWLVEIYDPAKPSEQAYQRFGTDTGGMIDPRVI